jgi:segregation and condensation protein B
MEASTPMADDTMTDEVTPAQAQPESPAAADEQPDGAVAAVDAVAADRVNAEDAGDAGGSADASVELPALEALLFSTHHPLTAGRLAELLQLDSTKPIRRAIRDLNDQYESTGRCFRVEQVAGGYQMLTLPEFGPIIKTLVQKEIDARLSKSALETLAIIAYKQPILRVDVESIRGVACGETIRSLMEKHLVKIAGRAEVPGRPILYGTTKRFLEVFGLNNLNDLPKNEQPKQADLKPKLEVLLPERDDTPASEASAAPAST